MKVLKKVTKKQHTKDHHMTSSIKLENWVVITPQRDAYAIDEVISKMQQVSNLIGFNIGKTENKKK